jgi:hypothetical protein
MSSLAAATAAFTKKKEEGLALLVAKRELEELKESGVCGTVTISITDAHLTGASLGAVKLTYKIACSEGEGEPETGAEAADGGAKACELGEKVKVNLTSLDSTILFTGTYSYAAESSDPALLEEGEVVEAKADQESFDFTASFSCKEAPEDTSLTCDLETSDANLVLRIQVCYDSCDANIEAKVKEFEQNEEECKELVQKVKDASTNKYTESSPERSAGSGKKKTPKKSSSKSADESRTNAAAVGTMSWTRTQAEKVFKTASFIGGEVMQRRAYWLFAAASITIFYFGEYASV